MHGNPGSAAFMSLIMGALLHLLRFDGQSTSILTIGDSLTDMLAAVWRVGRRLSRGVGPDGHRTAAERTITSSVFFYYVKKTGGHEPVDNATKTVVRTPHARVRTADGVPAGDARCVPAAARFGANAVPVVPE